MAPAAGPFAARLPAPLRYGVACALVVGVGLLDAAAGRFIDEGSRFLLLGTAVMASAWLGGTGPALLAIVAGAVLGSIDATGAAVDMHLALFIVHGLLVTFVVAEMSRARQLAEARMQEAETARLAGDAAHRMKDEFLATISHELRTPLNAMLGWVHLLRTGALDSPLTQRGLESIERNARQQARITGDLLDLSRALTGRLRVESRVISLTEAARQAAEAARPAARARQVELLGDWQGESVMVLGDQTRLRQIIWQLLANALKFTPSGGRIEVTVRAAGDRAEVTVADTGLGIDEAFLPRVFDRFTQEDASTTRAATGLGIGLSLVRDLVELHGGDITASNAPAGGGAVFTARFPLQQVALAPVTRPIAARTMPGLPLDGVRVLVMDHDDDGREALQLMLQQRGAQVLTTGSVEEALEALEGWRPDVLLSDTPAHDTDSYALTGRVPHLDPSHGGRIPSLALTRFARTDDRVREMLADTVRDLPRPVEPNLLTAEIEGLIARSARAAS